MRGFAHSQSSEKRSRSGRDAVRSRLFGERLHDECQARLRRQQADAADRRSRDGRLCNQPDVVDHADGVVATQRSDPRSIHLLRQSATRRRPRAFPPAHGLFRNRAVRRRNAGRRSRCVSGRLGQRSARQETTRRQTASRGNPPPPAKPVASTPAPAAPVRAAAPPAPAPAPAPQAAAPPVASPVAEAAKPHPFDATPPPPVLKYEPEPEPFQLTDEPDFKPANMPVVQPPATPVASAPPTVAAAKPATKLAAARAARSRR